MTKQQSNPNTKQQQKRQVQLKQNHKTHQQNIYIKEQHANQK